MTLHTAAALIIEGAQAVHRISMQVLSSNGHHSDLHADSHKVGVVNSCWNENKEYQLMQVLPNPNIQTGRGEGGLTQKYAFI